MGKIIIDGIEYKLSKVENDKEHEILTVKEIGVEGENRIVECKNAGFFNPDYYKINSVKRLSDNEVFTIGDNTNVGIISKFDFEGEKLFLNANNSTGHRYSLHILDKIPKQSLFTTEDKVDIYEGMYYWFVSKKFDVLYQDNANKYLDDGSVRFAIEGNANEYVLMNKPCLSLNDFGEWYEKWYSNNPMKEAYLNGLKELAKQKING